VVEEVSEGVTAFKKGDKVWVLPVIHVTSTGNAHSSESLHEGFYANDKAGFQQYTIVPAEIVAKANLWSHKMNMLHMSPFQIPDNISFDEAASVPLCIFTAAVGLYDPLSGNNGAGLTPPWEPNGAGK
jgi:NADPH:quinone reductase-like Zn-dependent oxidoreductase